MRQPGMLRSNRESHNVGCQTWAFRIAVANRGSRLARQSRPCGSLRFRSQDGYLQRDFMQITFHVAGAPPMARVTVEDCIDKVENRFDLVLLASHRARMISSGSPDHDRARQRQEPGRRAARDRRNDHLARGPEGRPDPLAAEVCRGRRAGGRDRAADRRRRRLGRRRRYRGRGRPDDRRRAAQGLEGLAPPEEQPETEEE